jgi:aspartate racemase
MTNTGTVGILGGMGPLATLELFRRILAMTPASRDQDHLRIVIDNNPHIPDRTAAILQAGEDALPLLRRTARGLENAGADFIAIPCNSAHHYLEGIQEAVHIPVLDMIGETVGRIKEHEVGLLATDGVLRARVYHKMCERKGIDLVEPSAKEQKRIMAMIYDIKAGRDPATHVEGITELIERLRQRGAAAIIVGCTELSLIPNKDHFSLPVYDALDILAQVAVERALAGRENC